MEAVIIQRKNISETVATLLVDDECFEIKSVLQWKVLKTS